jgi:hypothetical protein
MALHRAAALLAMALLAACALSAPTERAPWQADDDTGVPLTALTSTRSAPSAALTRKPYFCM